MTHVGNVRELNEDAYFVSERLWVVADGMGGHEAGDVASALAVDACRNVAASAPITIDRVAELIAEANQRVRSYATAHELLGMGCTMVGAALVDNGGAPSVVVFNVGDSRCYTMSGGELRQVTTDHSYVQELVDAGRLSEQAAATHPERNVVTRAVGIDAQAAADFTVLPDTDRVVRLLICSDGLHGELASATIEEMLDTAASAQETADALGATVLEGRAGDNLTAVVVDIALPPPRPAGATATAADDTTGPRRRNAEITTQPRRRRRALIDEVPR